MLYHGSRCLSWKLQSPYMKMNILLHVGSWPVIHKLFDSLLVRRMIYSQSGHWICSRLLNTVALIYIYMWIFNLKKLKKYHLFALLNRISQLYNSPSWDTGGCCCQCWWVQCVPSLSSAIFHQPLHYFDVCDLWWWVAELLHNLAYNKR